MVDDDLVQGFFKRSLPRFVLTWLVYIGLFVFVVWLVLRFLL